MVTQFLVVSDQDRSRNFYQSVFGADVVRDRDPVILALANTRIVLNVGGGPTDDKPTVRLAPPADPDVSSGFLNLRVRDIAQAYRDWSARGATFLTERKDHGYETRAHIRDPDGHLIEVGQTQMPSCTAVPRRAAVSMVPQSLRHTPWLLVPGRGRSPYSLVRVGSE